MYTHYDLFLILLGPGDPESQPRRPVRELPQGMGGGRHHHQGPGGRSPPAVSGISKLPEERRGGRGGLLSEQLQVIGPELEGRAGGWIQELYAAGLVLLTFAHFLSSANLGHLLCQNGFPSLANREGFACGHCGPRLQIQSFSHNIAIVRSWRERKRSFPQRERLWLSADRCFISAEN